MIVVVHIPLLKKGDHFQTASCTISPVFAAIILHLSFFTANSLP